MLERFGTFSRMFELHHIDPNKKADDYNNLIKQKLSTRQLDELDKCILLCRNCHGLVHAQNTQANALLSIDYGGQKVEQELSGWLVADVKNNSIQFLCEEKLLVEPYIEQLGDDAPSIIYGVDLKEADYFFGKVKSLKDGEVYIIRSAESKKVLLRVTRNDDNLKVEQDLAFRFLEMDANNAPKGERFWFRNGILLQDNGDILSSGVFTFHLLASRLP